MNLWPRYLLRDKVRGGFNRQRFSPADVGALHPAFDVVELTHDGLGFSADIQSLLIRGIPYSAEVYSGVV